VIANHAAKYPDVPSAVLMVASSGRDISIFGTFHRSFPTVVHDHLLIMLDSRCDISIFGTFHRTFPTVIHDHLLIVLDNNDTIFEIWVEKKNGKIVQYIV
jgi:hypothetical protein